MILSITYQALGMELDSTTYSDLYGNSPLEGLCKHLSTITKWYLELEKIIIKYQLVHYVE